MQTETLWENYHEAVQRYVRRATNNDSETEDIVQDAFMKIYAHRDALRDEQKIKPWIYQIVRNTITDHYRKRRPTLEIPELAANAEELAMPDHAADVIACFASTIPRLPDIYREALELSELQGMSQKQLSSHLGISYSAAKSRVQRGREMLKTMLTGCCHIESDAYGNITDFYIKLAEPPVYQRKRRKA
ncbi:RNA polymerase sigma factor SigZ [Paenibacillus macerans]|uniref:RNA polymerase sigma factor SigZ n=1 Tax=Paenibacillus sp. FSL R5-0527 TaxID=2975321 RepID=UPI00097A5C44|nr:hypothetical protein BK140_21170 [Paenibacillus macerans]GJM68579.1 RNA polymerase sigma factor SigZ [Paenibacillus macerans]